MRLPLPSETYNPVDEKQRNDEIMRSDRENHKKGRHIEVGKDCGVMFSDSDGGRWLMTIDTSGNILLTLQ